MDAQAATGDATAAREQLANELADQVPLASAAGTAAGTFLANRFFGMDASAATLAGTATGHGEKMTLRELGKRTAADTAEEMIQGVPEDYIQHSATVQADPTEKFDLGNTLVSNAAAGLAMGGGGHGIGFINSRLGKNTETNGTAPNPNEAPQNQNVTAPDSNAPAENASPIPDAANVPDTANAPEAANVLPAIPLSRQLGLDPDAGSLSAAAALAVDSGASPAVTSRQAASEGETQAPAVRDPMRNASDAWGQMTGAQRREAARAAGLQGLMIHAAATNNDFSRFNPQLRAAMAGIVNDSVRDESRPYDGQINPEGRQAYAQTTETEQAGTQRAAETETGTVARTGSGRHTAGGGVSGATRSGGGTGNVGTKLSRLGSAARSSGVSIPSGNTSIPSSNTLPSFGSVENARQAIAQASAVLDTPKASVPAKARARKTIETATRALNEEKDVGAQFIAPDPTGARNTTSGAQSAAASNRLPAQTFSEAAIDAAAQSGTVAPAKPAKPVVQNRSRANPASIQQMQSIAGNPDYGRLSSSRDFTNGAPVVTGGFDSIALGRKDYSVTSSGRRIATQYAIVDASEVQTSNFADGSPNANYGQGGKQAVAGNGRIAGLIEAHKRGTARNYQAELMEDLAILGIDPAEVEQVKNPILVRVMPDSEVTANIGDESNSTGTLQLSAVEQARNDSQRLDLNDLEFNEDGNPSNKAVREFVQGMPQAEQGNLIDTHGQPSRRVFT
ncbi:MAG: hypothetical protein LBU43_07975 [Candidatus Accumulibacter sp.]|jgi:hypothetical protein|nr:hypothetical protein [Accumulibacter sp.]